MAKRLHKFIQFLKFRNRNRNFNHQSTEHGSGSLTEIQRGVSEHERVISVERIRKATIDIVWLIVTHHPDAIRYIEQLNESGGLQEVEAQLRFEISWTLPNRCNCWFELEYSDFMARECVNETMLKQICENIKRGSCMHASDENRNNSYTLVGFAHIAAGCRNDRVLCCLLNIHARKRFEASAHGLLPIHVAILKSNESTVRLLLVARSKHNIWNTRYLYPSPDTGDIVWAKRDKDTGDVKFLTFLRCNNNITKLFFMMDEHSDDLLSLVLPLLETDWVNKLLDDLMNCKKRNLVQRILSVDNRSTKKMDPVLLFRCALVNDKDNLQTLIKRGLSVKHVLYRHNILDVAAAVGSIDCCAVLRNLLERRKDGRQFVSPYMFLIMLASSHSTNPEIIVESMTRLNDQGHDVNLRDEYGMTPLHQLIYARLKYNPEVTYTLLATGADVNATLNLLTPLDCAMEYGREKGFVKDIFKFNPVLKDSQFAMKKAVQMDIASDSILKHLTKTTEIIFKASAETEDDIIANTLDDRLLALSYAALLYEFGFDIDQECELEFHGDQCYINLFKQYLKRTASTPRSLQALCRLMIRKSCSVRPLNDNMDKLLNVPTKLYNYVFKPCSLRYVEVKIKSAGGVENVVYADRQKAIRAKQYSF